MGNKFPWCSKINWLPTTHCKLGGEQKLLNFLELDFTQGGIQVVYQINANKFDLTSGT
jgi:hypothetical protein